MYGIILISTEVIYENRKVRTTVVERDGGIVCKVLCSVNSVDCETSMVRVPQANVTHEERRKATLVLSEQSSAILPSLFSRLLSIFDPRGDATTVPARTRVTKERNGTIVSG